MRFFQRSRTLGEEDATRVVRLHELDAKRTNFVRTRKYNPITFVPMNLWDQLTQACNAYYVVMTLLQMVKAVSNTKGEPTMLIPLSMVLVMAMAKEGWEDWQRRLEDRKKNRMQATSIDEKMKEKSVQSMELRPGMLFKVRQGQTFPSDGLLLATSRGDSTCSVETSNLDGETYLKAKTAILSEAEWLSVTRAKPSTEPLTLTCGPPSVELYQFLGKVTLPGRDMKPANIDHLALCGTSLEQTEWVLCMAVYCGHETRAMMNSQAPRFKTSKLDDDTSMVVFAVVLATVFLCIGMSIAQLSMQDHGAKYLGKTEAVEGFFETIVAFFTGVGIWVLQIILVPPSLIVTCVLVKFFQARFLECDEKCGASGGKPAKVNCCQVMETLGTVTHVFSDKTGTLTQNVMEFKACHVGGHVYGLGKGGKRTAFQASNVDFDGTEWMAHLQKDPKHAALLANFLLVQALCHTVEPNTKTEGEGSSCPYQASSPDELALTCFAKALGVEFVNSAKGIISLRITGEKALSDALKKVCGYGGGGTMEIPLLDMCAFDNTRKRMSVVVRYPNGRIVVMIKGADSSVLPFCNDEGAKAAADRDLTTFAGTGLRTLCLATRDISEAAYQDWHGRYNAALADLTDARDTLVAKVVEELELGGALSFAGATAIDDKLQKDVPETIRQLRDAGLRVWMLTGDKVETALSIAKSCKLLTPSMETHVLEGTNAEQLEEALDDVMESTNPSTAIAVAGDALAILLSQFHLSRKLALAAQECRVVIGCRVSPKQKADVVQLVREHVPTCQTLAIGDGANDVSMIIAAHVGVGISGKEGAQAAMSADFAIAEFRFLRRLLFVHGRESYRRLAVVVSYFFYKNSVITFPLVVAARDMLFSGSNFVHPFLFQLTNLFYTQLAVFIYGFFDRAVKDLDDLELDARNYAPCLFSFAKTFMWQMAAFLQILVYYKVLMPCFCLGRPSNGNEVDDLGTLSDFVTVWVVVGANWTLARCTHSWYWWTWIPYALNLFALIFTLCLFSWPETGVWWQKAVGRDDPDFPVTISAMIGGNFMRYLAISMLALLVHSLIDDLTIFESGIWFKDLIDWFMDNTFGRLLACCGLRLPSARSSVKKFQHIPEPMVKEDTQPTDVVAPLMAPTASTSLLPLPSMRGKVKKSIIAAQRFTRGFAMAQDDATEKRLIASDMPPSQLTRHSSSGRSPSIVGDAVVGDIMRRASRIIGVDWADGGGDSARWGRRSSPAGMELEMAVRSSDTATPASMELEMAVRSSDTATPATPPPPAGA